MKKYSITRNFARDYDGIVRGNCPCLVIFLWISSIQLGMYIGGRHKRMRRTGLPSIESQSQWRKQFWASLQESINQKSSCGICFAGKLLEPVSNFCQQIVRARGNLYSLSLNFLEKDLGSNPTCPSLVTVASKTTHYDDCQIEKERFLAEF